MHIHTVNYFLITMVLKGLIKPWNGGCGSEKQSFSADVNIPLKPVIHRYLAAMFKACRLMAGYLSYVTLKNPCALWELGLVIE